jgi:hypothetical protein
MWGGGFLKHGSETSNYNHELLRKTKGKKSSTDRSLTRPGGTLVVEELTDQQRKEVAELLAKARKEDRRKALIVSIISVILVGAIVYLIFS